MRSFAKCKVLLYHTNGSKKSNIVLSSGLDNETIATMVVAMNKQVGIIVAVVADSQFITPTNIKFTDLSSMMKPSVTGTSGSNAMPDQKQVEEMMKQYGEQQ